jgi:excisionase family DNA binding protein
MLSYDAAAERLAVHRNTVANLVRKGVLPVVRLSSNLARIPAKAVAALIEQRIRNDGCHG